MRRFRDDMNAELKRNGGRYAGRALSARPSQGVDPPSRHRSARRRSSAVYPPPGCRDFQERVLETNEEEAGLTTN
jgi:hypothetical protein